MERTIRRGDIYYAELNPVVGSEQGGIRPVLIISNDIGNSHSPTVIIAAITGKTQTKAKLPTHTEVKDVEGLDRDSIILLEQIRTIDKRRLREYMGTLDKRFLPAMDKALAISIGLNGYSHCPMKQGRLSASLPAHECCPLHDDSVQKKGLAPSLYGTIIRSYIENEGGVACWSIENLGMLASLFQN